MTKPLHLITLLFAIITMSSCVKEYKDMVNIDSVELENFDGVYALPFVNAEVTLKDLIDKYDSKNYVRTNANGYLSLYFDTVNYSAKLSDYLKIPNINESIKVPILPTDVAAFALVPNGSTYKIVDNKTIVSSMTIDSFSLDAIDFLSGSLNLTFPTLNQEVTYEVDFIDIKKDNVVSKIKKVVPPGATATSTLDLSKAKWDLTNNNSGSNTLRITVSVSVKKTSNEIFPSDVFFGIGVNEITYYKILGYLGSVNLPAIEVNLPINFFDDNPVPNAISIENPIINMDVTNEYQLGVGMAVRNNIVEVNTKSSGIINVSGITLPNVLPAPNSTTPWEGSQEIARNISPPLVDVIQKNPNNIHFFLNTWLSPGAPNGKFTLEHDDKISIKTTLEMPLSVKANRFKLYKKFQFRVKDIQNGDTVLDKVMIKMKLDNTFAFSVEAQAGFVDPSTGKVIRNILPDSYILLPSGDVGAPQSKVTEIEISGAEWADMASKGVDEIELTLYFSTPTMTQFYSIKEAMGIHAKIGAKIFTQIKE